MSIIYYSIGKLLGSNVSIKQAFRFALHSSFYTTYINLSNEIANCFALITEFLFTEDRAASSSDRQTLLNKHNEYRERHNAPALTLDNRVS